MTSRAEKVIGKLNSVREASFKPNKRLLKVADNPLKTRRGYEEINVADVVEYSGGLKELKKKFKYREDVWDAMWAKAQELTSKLFNSYSEIGELDGTELYQWICDNWDDVKASLDYLYKKFPKFKKEMNQRVIDYQKAGYDSTKAGKKIRRDVEKAVLAQLKKIDKSTDWGEDYFYLSDQILGIQT